MGGTLYQHWPFIRLVVESRADDRRAQRASRGRALEERIPAATHRGSWRWEWRDPLAAVQADAVARCADEVRRRHNIPGDAVLLAAFGGITPEKRIPQVLRALSACAERYPHLHLMLVGEQAHITTSLDDARAWRVADRVHVTGYVSDEALREYLVAADLCACLRWPTNRETSASWLRCLAAGRPTLITDLTQLADVPTLDPRGWRVLQAAGAAHAPVAVSIDLLDEDHSLQLAHRAPRGRSGAAQRSRRRSACVVEAHHQLAADGRRVRCDCCASAAGIGPPHDRPAAHLTTKGSAGARAARRSRPRGPRPTHFSRAERWPRLRRLAECARIVAVGLALSVAGLRAAAERRAPEPVARRRGHHALGRRLLARLSEPDVMPRIRPPDLSAASHTDRRHRRRPGARRRDWASPPAHPSPAAHIRSRRCDCGVTPIARGRPPPCTWQPPTLEQARRLQPQPVWQLDAETRGAWLRQHAAPLVQMAGFLAGALILVVLGSRGLTATLMTLALMFTADRQRRTAARRRARRSLAGELLLIFGWMATALSFPIIGLAVLHFPTRAPILDRHPWILPALCVLPAPVLVVSLTAAAFLLRQRADARAAGVVCDATRGSSTRPSRSPSPPTSRSSSRASIATGRTSTERAPAHSDRRLHRRPGGVRVCDQGRRAAGAARWPGGRSSCRG